MTAPREIPINQSCQRPHLLLGADRQLIIVAATLCSVIPIMLKSLPSLVAGVLLWIILHWVLTRMAKADPMAFPIYNRHRRYRDYYPARSGLYAVAPAVGANWGKR